jgi:hypothetical protein
MAGPRFEASAVIADKVNTMLTDSDLLPLAPVPVKLKGCVPGVDCVVVVVLAVGCEPLQPARAARRRVLRRPGQCRGLTPRHQDWGWPPDSQSALP